MSYSTAPWSLLESQLSRALSSLSSSKKAMRDNQASLGSKNLPRFQSLQGSNSYESSTRKESKSGEVMARGSYQGWLADCYRDLRDKANLVEFSL